MLGKLISDTGAAQRIATTLIDTFGKKRVQWALVITGLVVGLAMFFEVGFVPAAAAGIYGGGLFRSAAAVCRRADGGGAVRNPLFPAAASGPHRDCHHFRGQSRHHPAGAALLFTIPTVIVAGPLFSKLLTRFEKAPPEGYSTRICSPKKRCRRSGTVSFRRRYPGQLLMAVAAVCEITLPKSNSVRVFFEFIGNPAVALFIAIVLVSIFTLGLLT